MKRRYLVLGLVGLALLVGYQFVPREPTEADLRGIKRVVGRRTSAAVLKIEPLASGAVEVQTGWAKGPLYGDGEVFRLRKAFGVWWIYRSGRWSS